MLHSLIRNIRPRVVVEVGSFLSVSTHWIASALQANGDGGVVHCFDDFGPVHKGPWRDAEMLDGRLEWVKERLSKAGLIDLVRFHPGDSSTQICEAHGELARGGGVDVALKLIKGEAVDKVTYVPFELVTPANAADYIGKN